MNKQNAARLFLLIVTVFYLLVAWHELVYRILPLTLIFSMLLWVCSGIGSFYLAFGDKSRMDSLLQTGLITVFAIFGYVALLIVTFTGILKPTTPREENHA